MKRFLPEGSLINTAENINALRDPHSLAEAMRSRKILEARVSICTSSHDLIVDIPGMNAVIPREEGAVGISDGTTRDIALITKVNKPVCFRVISIKEIAGKQTAILSRRSVQQDYIDSFTYSLRPGDIISAKVTHLEQFGAFVDIGCGIPSLIPIDSISVSRISHPSDRFSVGQDIRAVVKGINGSRVWLSHKELLGTWTENAALFSCGETVSGTIRSVEEYGIFVELMPNLAGLAEPRTGVREGQHAGVYIKALIPEKMKVKLILVDVFDDDSPLPPIKYFTTGEHIDRWTYSTSCSEKTIETQFQ